MSIERRGLVTLDRVPIALGAMLCVALALLWWLAPGWPAAAVSAQVAAVDFSAALARLRRIVWPSLLVFVEAGATVARNALGTELFPTHLRATAKSWITNAAPARPTANRLGGGARRAPGDERPRARGDRTSFGVSAQVHFASASTRGAAALSTASSAASIEPTVVHNPACSG
jgi:hypothetical protein